MRSSLKSAKAPSGKAGPPTPTPRDRELPEPAPLRADVGTSRPGLGWSGSHLDADLSPGLARPHRHPAGA